VSRNKTNKILSVFLRERSRVYIYQVRVNDFGSPEVLTVRNDGQAL